MKWPFVRRQLYDDCLEVLENERDKMFVDFGARDILEHSLREALREIEALRQDKLVLQRELEVARTQYDDLKLMCEAKESEPEKPLKSKLTTVIRDQARGADGTINQALVNHFRRRARELRDMGMSEDKIIDRLRSWQTTEDAHSLTIDTMTKFADQDKTP